jgi:Cu(I)/Ag(I) efflux system periplasmic protein CusF
MTQVPKLALTLALGLSAASFTFANDAHHAAATPQVAQAAAMTDGEVKKVDKSTGKITIKHGPLTKLEMPAMTMVFRVADPTMLDQVKPGDKIKFDADKVKGALTVVAIQPV